MSEVKLKFWSKIQVMILILACTVTASLLETIQNSCQNPTGLKAHGNKWLAPDCPWPHGILLPSKMWQYSRLLQFQFLLSSIPEKSISLCSSFSPVSDRKAPLPWLHITMVIRCGNSLYFIQNQILLLSDCSNSDCLIAKWVYIGAQTEFPVFILVVRIYTYFVLTLLRCKWQDQIQSSGESAPVTYLFMKDNGKEKGKSSRIRESGVNLKTKITHRLNLKLQVIFLLQQGHHFLFQLFPFCLRLCKLFLGFFKLLLHVGHLLLRFCTLQQGLHLEVQFHPGPVLDIHECSNIVLDDINGFSENTWKHSSWGWWDLG